VVALVQGDTGSIRSAAYPDLPPKLPKGFNLVGQTTILDALQKSSTTPSVWEFVKLEDGEPSLNKCAAFVRDGADTFAEYSVIYGVVAHHNDGSTSPFFRNIPPVTQLNRCAETALAAYLENLDLEGKGSKVTQITLVGYTPPDPLKDRFQFSNHPNPCALCRDRLLTLLQLGILDENTKVLNVALNQDGSIPKFGRMTTIGSLILGSSKSSSQQDLAPNFENETLAKLRELFPDISLNEDSFSELIDLASNRLINDHGESCIIFGLSKDNSLKAIVAEPQTISLKDEKVENFSSATVALTAAIKEEFSKVFIIDFSRLPTVSNVTAQRYLDYSQHLEGMAGESDDCLSIVHVGFDENNGLIFGDYDPRVGLPLGEGMRDRGRESLLDRDLIRFSSKLGFGWEVIQRILPHARIVCLSDTSEISDAQKSIGGGQISGSNNGTVDSTNDGPQITNIHEENVNLKEITAERISEIESDLTNKIQSWRAKQPSISAHPAPLHPNVTAVIATTADGSPLENLSSVNALSVTFESHAPDSLVHVLGQILNNPLDVGMEPPLIHIASTNSSFQLTSHHKQLLDVIKEIHGFMPKLVHHNIEELS
jgi:hypothetical protein